jgi:hypothetical protein
MAAPAKTAADKLNGEPQLFLNLRAAEIFRQHIPIGADAG